MMTTVLQQGEQPQPTSKRRFRLLTGLTPHVWPDSLPSGTRPPHGARLSMSHLALLVICSQPPDPVTRQVTRHRH